MTIPGSPGHCSWLLRKMPLMSFISSLKRIEKKLGTSLIFIRSGHGTEFENVKFLKFYLTNGINHNFSTPRTPQQNGVVERKNKTLQDLAWTMMLTGNLVKNFWAEAIGTAFTYE